MVFRVWRFGCSLKGSSLLATIVNVSVLKIVWIHSSFCSSREKYILVSRISSYEDTSSKKNRFVETAKITGSQKTVQWLGNVSLWHEKMRCKNTLLYKGFIWSSFSIHCFSYSSFSLTGIILYPLFAAKRWFWSTTMKIRGNRFIEESILSFFSCYNESLTNKYTIYQEPVIIIVFHEAAFITFTL